MTNDQGLPGYRGHLNKECLTIAEALNPFGYFTAMAGKWHVGGAPEFSPARRGFQESLSMISGGLHFDNQTGSKGDTQLFRNGEEISRQAPQFNPPWYGTDLWTDQGLEFVKSREKSEEPFFLYLAHVAPHFPCMAPEETIAKYRGKFMKGWDQLREERFARQIELGLIEPSWPLGIEANPEWVTSPAHVIDLMTTCLELSEATYPKSVGERQIAPLPGVSLRPLFDGKAKLPARTLFWEHEGNAAARKGDWKIVRRGRQGEWELYNLREDRTEQDNLSQEHRPIFKKLLAEWEQ